MLTPPPPDKMQLIVEGKTFRNYTGKNDQLQQIKGVCHFISTLNKQTRLLSLLLKSCFELPSVHNPFIFFSKPLVDMIVQAIGWQC